MYCHTFTVIVHVLSVLEYNYGGIPTGEKSRGTEKGTGFSQCIEELGKYPRQKEELTSVF